MPPSIHSHAHNSPGFLYLASSGPSSCLWALQPIPWWFVAAPCSNNQACSFLLEELLRKQKCPCWQKQQVEVPNFSHKWLHDACLHMWHMTCPLTCRTLQCFWVPNTHSTAQASSAFLYELPPGGLDSFQICVKHYHRKGSFVLSGCQCVVQLQMLWFFCFMSLAEYDLHLPLWRLYSRAMSSSIIWSSIGHTIPP